MLKQQDNWQQALFPDDELVETGSFSEASHSRLIAIHKTTSSILSNIVIVVGCLGLTGWIIDSAILKSMVPGLATMKVNTALLFILAGLSLWVLVQKDIGPKRRLLGQGLALVATIIGFLTVIEYIVGWDIGLDHMFFYDFDTPLELFPGRMSPATALCFFLIGSALLLLGARQDLLAQLFSIAAGFVSLLALIGYGYDVDSLYAIYIYSSMAIHTTIAFLLLSWGVLFGRPDQGMMAVIISNTVGGNMARRLLPIAIIIPLGLGMMILLGQQLGLYDAHFGTSLLVLSSIAIFCVLISWNAYSLYGVDLERKRITKALGKAEKKYRNIFENTMEGIYQMLPSGQFITANPALARMLHYESTKVLLNELSYIKKQLFVRPEDYTELVEQVEEQGFAQDFEAQLRCSDGSKIWALLSMHGIRDREGRLSYYEGVVVNISKHKQAEKERQDLEAQLQQAQKIESIGRLAGGIAHDFNNLLVPIMGYAELGAMKLSPEDKLYGDLMQVRQAAERAAGLTRQILAFSRQQVLKMEILDLSEVINALTGMFQSLIRDDIQFRTILTSSLYQVEADKGQIEQVLMNLVVNACDAMPDGGKLTIETANIFLDERYAAKHVDANPGPHVMLAISDNGQGMDTETQARIFDPFFTTKERGKGTGLGLATVFGIVKQHRGNIWVYSEPGSGTTFKIYLPQATDLSQASEPVIEDAVSIYGTETILVTEDEEMVRKLVCETLEAHGYHIIESRSPRQSLQLAENYKGQIHLLLTDVIMPHMNGRELHHRLVELHPDSKVLYMSGYTDNVIIHHNILDDGVNFLQKPFSVHNLMKKVRQALG